MKVNFNNVRKQAIFAYDSLVEKLNDSIVKEKQFADVDGEHCNIKGYVLIDANEIQKNIDSLRKMIGVIAMTAIEGDDEFKDVYSEVFPIEGEKRMQSFNQEEEV